MNLRRMDVAVSERALARRWDASGRICSTSGLQKPGLTGVCGLEFQVEGRSAQSEGCLFLRLVTALT